MKLRITPLAAQHDRQDFDCGEPALNAFLQRLARQQSDRDFNRTYVAEVLGEPRIHGFYAVSAAAVNFENFPKTLKLPRYPVPAARIGRLAVDQRSQGAGVGVALLQHAMDLAESLSQLIGLYALFVEAKNETAAAFYLRYGFQRLPDHPLNLFLTTDLIRRARAASMQH
jgi:GNAT superfamily N-acetyltransferase